jgi:biliverdin reductase
MRIGLIGTGYAATKRAEAIRTLAKQAIVAGAASEWVPELVAIASQNPARSQAFGQTHSVEALPSWQALLEDSTIDLVIVSTVNVLHGPVVEAALRANKHVVVEYPLSLEVHEAQALIQLAAKKQRLLHVEHIELIGGLHQAIRTHLAAIGQPTYAHYRTINPQHPAPAKWSYDLSLSGFPLVSALSRVHRLIHLFGTVEQVSCQSRFDPPDQAQTGYPTPYYGTCLCSAQLRFTNGVIAEITYGKGEHLWHYSRYMEIQGSQGGMVCDRDTGILINAQGEQAIPVEPRQGLFLKDTQQVLAHLQAGDPLYVANTESLYALKVAEALRLSAASEHGEWIKP